MAGEVVRNLGTENPFYSYSTPMIRGRLFDLIADMKVRPLHDSAG